MQELWQSFGHTITNILPTSPFAQKIAEFSQWPALAWLNWLVPVQEIMQVMGVWLGAITVFYLAQIVLRWVKVIQG